MTSDARLLSGWGRTTRSRATVIAPASVEALGEALDAPGARGVLARGLGRAYGDAAQNAGGLVLDMKALAGVREFDEAAGTVTVEAGVSLEALTRFTLPRGWMPAVVPGTRFVTVGGAIAADIHGKNHHRDGGFGRHVRELELLTAGGVRRLLPGSEAFAATVGGMGLTGVIVSATLELMRVPSGLVREEVTRTERLGPLLEQMLAGDAAHRYSVAWIDAAARTFRGLLLRGDHAAGEEAATLPPARLRAPRRVPGGLLGRPTVRAFNELWLRRHRPGVHVRLTPLARYFWPLDGVRGWNRLYGERGLLQYQCVVPDGAEAVVEHILAAGRRAGIPSTLVVLKRLGDGEAPLAFAQRGWTIALDYPASAPGLDRLLDGFDDLVAQAGGRVYLAKDARLQPDALRAMYPRLGEWRAARERLDPAGIMRSDLARRLELV